MKHKKDFLSITDLTRWEILDIILHALQLKEEYKKKKKLPELLKNKTLVMIFEKPSLRTRLSFEIGMTKLGGHAVYLGPSEIGMGVRESVSDIAQVAGRMGDMIMTRTFSHKTLEELAKHAKIPVINGLSELEHPCQALADFMTICEIKGKLQGLKIAFIGDGENNVTHSLCLGSALLGMSFACASPNGYQMNSLIINKHNAAIKETNDPKVAVENADIVYTDTWISMGDEEEKEERQNIFIPYQVTNDLMGLAKKDAIFMHDLPAYRGNEVAAEVIDGPQSVIFQQAENRMWAQMALLLSLFKKSQGGEING